MAAHNLAHVSSVAENLYRVMVELSGAKYEGICDLQIPGFEPLCIFSSRDTGVLSGLPLSHMTAWKVYDRVREIDAMYDAVKIQPVNIEQARTIIREHLEHVSEQIAASQFHDAERIH